MRLLDAYVADPVLVRGDDAWYLFGTDPTATTDRAFAAHTSPDLRSWTSLGGALERLPGAHGDAYWAPEVVQRDGSWWMYYSVGHDDRGHRLRVASAPSPAGPFRDCGVVLTPGEPFAIDPHPFRDDDGHWYLFFARDVLDHDRPGTHLAVVRLDSPDAVTGPVTEVLGAFDDWQIYRRDRPMYGARYDWHTLEGPSVVRRHGRCWMTYSGGAWTGDRYQVSWAVADHPLGPWRPAPPGTEPLLATGRPEHAIGPGHNSLACPPGGDELLIYHSWDRTGTRREPHAIPVEFAPSGPRSLTVDTVTTA